MHKKITTKEIQELAELIWDYTEYDVEGNRYNGYEVTPYLSDKSKKRIKDVLDARRV